MKQIDSILLIIFLAFQLQLFSQTIARYPSGSLSPDLVASNVAVTNISLGNGINQVPCSSYVIGSGFDQTTQNNALNNGDYFEFTITPNPGYAITITTISILTTGSNLIGTPLLGRALYYKKQSQSTFTFVSSYNSSSLGTNICTSSSSGSIPAPNVVSFEPITFRLVYYGNSSGVQARIGQITVSGNISIAPNITKIKTTNYPNLNLAINASLPNDTIDVIEDFTENLSIPLPQDVILNIPSSKTVTLDGTFSNNGTIINNGTLIKNTLTNNENGIYLGNGTFTGNFINNGTVKPGG